MYLFLKLVEPCDQLGIASSSGPSVDLVLEEGDSVLQIWGTIPSEQSSVLDGIASRSAARSAHSNCRSPLSNPEIATGTLQLDYALQNRAPLR